MKNRKREICTSGSVRDEAGQPPHLLGHRRQFLHLAAGAAALPTVSRFAWAQAYPSRPVRIVVGFPPGGGTDIAARLIGQGLSERLGQQFVIENHPGAGSNVATEAVVRASADGYTLLLVSAAHAINATLYDKLNYNSSVTSRLLPELSACQTSWRSILRFHPRAFPSSLPMPRPIRAKSTMPRAATGLRNISSVNCSR